MTVEHRTITSRDEWLRWRRQDVTASVVGALFGVHPYTTALRIYAEKRGVEFPDADNKTMRRGRWLEPAVATAVEEERPDWKLRAPRLYLRDPDLRLGCTPDYFIEGDPRGLGVLQCKTVAPSVYARDWLGGSEIPLTTDLGRAFLYARYDALLTKDGLTSLECGDIDPAHVSMLDSVEYMKELDRVGCAVGARVDVSKFGPLLGD